MHGVTLCGLGSFDVGRLSTGPTRCRVIMPTGPAPRSLRLRHGITQPFSMLKKLFKRHRAIVLLVTCGVDERDGALFDLLPNESGRLRMGKQFFPVALLVRSG